MQRPFKLEPFFIDYLWGGERLKESFGKRTDMSPLAESWELSAHPDGQSVIASGAFKGERFGDWIAAHPAAVGRGFKAGDEFPILIKLIDAREALSIQVHPDDQYARRVENQQGKTEMWVVLHADPGAFLYYGFDGTPDREEVRRRIEDGSVTEILHASPVKAGDVFFIPSGTVHAIGEGILIAEIQQSSNVTYRVYDFMRRGADGELRELHVDKALDVMEIGPAGMHTPGALPPVVAEGYTLQQLAACPYFTVTRLGLHGQYAGLLTADSFAAVLCCEGSASVTLGGETLQLGKGETAFLPAQESSYSLSGDAQLLIATV